MLILECSQQCYAVKIWPGDLDLFPMTLKSIKLQVLLRTMYVPSLLKIHWRMLILECSQGCYAVKLTGWPWPLTLKINRAPDALKDYVCTKFGQNPSKDVDSRVFTRMLRKDGRTDGSVTISLRNFVGERITRHTNTHVIWTRNTLVKRIIICSMLLRFFFIKPLMFVSG